MRRIMRWLLTDWGCLCVQPRMDPNNVLVVHSATSCSHPADYYNLMRHVVHPYWAADPPEHRLSNKPYKSLDHPTAVLPEDSLAFKVQPQTPPCPYGSLPAYPGRSPQSLGLLLPVCGCAVLLAASATKRTRTLFIALFCTSSADC